MHRRTSPALAPGPAPKGAGMTHRRWSAVPLAALCAASLILAGCGNDKAEGSSRPAGEEQPGSSTAKVAKIGVIVPLSGDLSAAGVGVRNAVDLAVRQANEKRTIKGWKLVVEAQDDTASPQVGAQVASKLASDGKVIGV